MGFNYKREGRGKIKKKETGNPILITSWKGR